MRVQACGLILAFQAILASEAAQTTRSFLQPDAASKLFHQVSGQWVERAKAALKDSKTEAEELSKMRSSCTKVTTAFVLAAKGDRSKAVEYMDNVCNEADDDLCKEFGRRLADQVQSNANQDGLDNFCEAFWHGPLKDKANDKSDELSPLKAKPQRTQAAMEHGHSRKDSKAEVHLEAEKIAAEGAKKRRESVAHPHRRSGNATTTKQGKIVPKPLDKEAEQKIKNATANALEAARFAENQKKKKLEKPKEAKSIKDQKIRKKPKL